VQTVRDRRHRPSLRGRSIIGDDRELGAHLGPHCWPTAIRMTESVAFRWTASTPPGLGAGESVPDVVSKEERMNGKVTHLIPSSGPESAGNPGTVGVASTALSLGPVK
jgi:hypothetical protein